MATKNFLLWLVSLSFLTSSLVACESFPVRTSSQRPGSEQVEQPRDPRDQPDVEKPAFLQKEAPKLGLILGGGGALSFAHIGFLQELENHKIPVHAIAGVEWGALIAGAYSLEKKAHAIEWKLLKLPVKKFESSGFFSTGKSSVKVTSFNDYLESIFGRTNFSESDIPFACSTVNISREAGYIHARGKLKKAIRSCWPYPPHFKIDNVAANLAGIADLASFLRKNGADLIVYVDVISKNKLMNEKDRNKQSAATLAWIENKSLVNLMKRPLLDEVIRISVSGHKINSYKSLRSIIRLGQVKSKAIVKGLSKKHDY